MKNFIKALFALPLAAALIFAGCSSSSGGGSNPVPETTTTTYTVAFNVNGGTADADKFGTQTVKENETAANPGYPEREHYTCQGWSENGELPAFDFAAKITKNLTLKAIWKIDFHTVSFDLNGATAGTTPPAQTVDYGSKITLPSTDGFEKTKADGTGNYTLLGWATSESAAEGISGEVEVTADITYYLAWTDKNVYTITYKDGENVLNTQNVAEGNKTSAIADPSKDGYTFSEWQKDGASFDFENTAVTENITLTASWSLVTYTVTYTDEKSGTLTADSAAKTESYTVESAAFTLCTLEKAGYTFNGWKDSDGNIVTEVVSGSTGDKTFTADWSLVTYSITYELNDGTNSTKNPSTYTIETETITFTAATKTGYTCTWTPASIAKGSTGDVTVTAAWTAIPVSSVTVSGAASVKFGGSITLTATVLPADALDRTVTWSVDDTSLASIDSATGVLTAGSTEGTVKVTATAGGVTSSAYSVKVVDPASTETITINKCGGWLETSYVEWAPTDSYTSFNVYVQKSGDSTWTKLDSQLTRSYAATAGGTTVDHWRADALGLAAGTYKMKVTGCTADGEVADSASTTGTITVTAHDRSGFAFTTSVGSSITYATNANCPGAYKLDGTLKDNALVIYLTQNTVDTVSADIITDSKGTKTSCTGVTNILLALKKCYETRPVAFRVVGDVDNDGAMTTDDSNFAGDFVIKGSGDSKRVSNGITVEGVGFDGVAHGWGARIANASGIEIRNLMFLECDSGELDNVGLQQNNDHIWVHNCTTTYGMHGSDSDQVKGDGAMDCKLSTYVTFSYNHFIDNGKCNLLGLKEGTTEGYYITYHHNWYDHSDSRHPRCRYYTAHVYNNYYDGNSKYGIGSTLGSSVFSEGNYYRACQYPMLTSMQGSDVYAGSQTYSLENKTFSGEDGGTIKAYNNYMTGKCTFIPYGASTYLLKGTAGTSVGSIDTKKHFDAYVVTSRTDTVPSTVTSYAGSNTYNNWDTDSGKMYKYTAQEPAAAKETVTAYAGTYYGGDFTYDWSGQTDPDTDHDEDATLRALIAAYKSKIVAIQGDGESSSGGDSGSGDGGDSGTTTPAVTISGTTAVAIGGTTTLTITTANFTGTPAITCSSSDTTVATVTDAGVVTGVKAGTATITVTATDGTDTAAKTVSVTVSDPSAAQVLTFPASNSFFTVSGNTATNKGSVTYGGTTYSTCLKMETATSITFTTTAKKTVKLVFGGSTSASGKKVKIDGTAVTCTAENDYFVVSQSIEAGSHTITKSDGINLFYISVE